MNKHEKLIKLLEDVQKIDKVSLEKTFAHHLEFTVGKNAFNFSNLDIYLSLAHTIRDHLIDRYNETQRIHFEAKTKRVYYISMEFLLGRSLDNALLNLGAGTLARTSMDDFGYNLEDICEQESDPGLGNGGLGRLAACFLDSMATLDLPAVGYGLRYDYGIFKQKIIDSNQTEIPDYWLSRGKPWELERFDFLYPVHFYGRVENYTKENGKPGFRWIDQKTVLAKAYDVPIPGFGTTTVNYLRLWSAEPSEEFDFQEFNQGDYLAAVDDRIQSQNITSVLYPNDSIYLGRELRLKQQYFLVCASLQDIIWRFKRLYKDWKLFPDKAAVQLNDTHPSLAIPELMRIFVDEENLEWEDAWDICQKTFAYTNHTILPEALEKWPVSLMEKLLPRHVQIIYEINSRFMKFLEKKGDDFLTNLSDYSLVEEGHEKMIRMANLAIVGSHSVNGVAALHTRLLKEKNFAHFYKLYPEKFQNKTNGITPRRWLAKCNPKATKLITHKIGKQWIKNLDDLKKLEKYSKDSAFMDSWQSVKKDNKNLLAKIVKDKTGILIDTESIFDVQSKRIHEYKRQLLNVISVVDIYLRLKNKELPDWTPRTVMIAGKAAPGYYIAKLIIRLINEIARVINNDSSTSDKLKLVFLPDYNVSFAERIIPATELSQQISTAGMEASGTGNMKFALNGAVTIGTLDGANVEIMEEVGKENIYIFGLTVDQVMSLRSSGYNPFQYYENNSYMKAALDSISNGFFSRNNKDEFKPIIDSLLYGGDYYLLLADYDSYINAQLKVSNEYKNRKLWTTKSILNCARIGKFSSDRTIAEYAKDIWNLKPVHPQKK